MSPQTLIRLLHLASPALPVGAYSYSQGLEWAVDSGVVQNEAEAGQWIADALHWSMARWEAPLVGRLVALWGDPEGGAETIATLNDGFLAARETAELRAETVQMGYSCLKVVPELFNGMAPDARLATVREPAFPTVWSCMAAASGASSEDGVAAYLWAWLENQVMGAIKLVPLGQSAGQRLLARLSAEIPVLAREACALPESEWSNVAPGLSLASSRHETQYSRLFRS
jgi:urease accessory protein